MKVVIDRKKPKRTTPDIGVDPKIVQCTSSATRFQKSDEVSVEARLLKMARTRSAESGIVK